MQPSVFKYRKDLIYRKFLVSALFLALTSVYWIFWFRSFASWQDYVMTLATVVFVAKLTSSLIQLLSPLPQVIINSSGIKDPNIGDKSIPWSAIQKLKIARLNNNYGGSIFIFADPRQLEDIRIPAWRRIAGLLIPALKRQEQKSLLCIMTPIIALETSMDNVTQALESFAGNIEIEFV